MYWRFYFAGPFSAAGLQKIIERSFSSTTKGLPPKWNMFGGTMKHLISTFSRSLILLLGLGLYDDPSLPFEEPACRYLIFVW